MTLTDVFWNPVVPKPLRRKQSESIHQLQGLLVSFLHRHALANQYKNVRVIEVPRRPRLEYLLRKHGFSGYTARFFGGSRKVKAYELPVPGIDNRIRFYTDLHHRVYLCYNHEVILQSHGRFSDTMTKVARWGSRPFALSDNRLERSRHIARAIKAVSHFLMSAEIPADDF